MAKSNHGRIGEALELLNEGLLPFVERELQSVYGKKWKDAAKQAIREDRGALKGNNINWDTQNLLLVMWDQWNAVFRNTLGHAERSLVSEMRDLRNHWAHQTPFSGDDAYRALDSIARLLTAVSASQADGAPPPAQPSMCSATLSHTAPWSLSARPRVRRLNCTSRLFR